MHCSRLLPLSLSLLVYSTAALAWQNSTPDAAKPAPARVDISTTISGNQEQPRTLYVLPWQESIAQIRIAAPGVTAKAEPLQPLDRQPFLRFIAAQSAAPLPANSTSTHTN